ncbi:MAG: hypothetical protein K6L75_15405 [Cellvibrionaceae bacterium]
MASIKKENNALLSQSSLILFEISSAFDACFLLIASAITWWLKQTSNHFFFVLCIRQKNF